MKTITLSKSLRIDNYLLEKGDTIRVMKKKSKKEAVDIRKIIKDLEGDFSGDNQEQMKGVQLLKGLATSDDELANRYMDELNKATTAISKKILGE